MKNFIFVLGVLFFGMVQVNAQTMSFDDVVIPENGKGSVKLKYETGGRTIIGYGFELDLPKGLSVEMKNGEPNWTPLDDNTSVTLVFQAPASFGFIPKSSTGKINDSGEYLMSFVLVADETLKQGDELKVQVKKAMMTEKVSDTDQQSIKFSDFSFKVTIGKPLVLDENSTTEPEATAGVETFKVIRTINANKWSTICFPFELTNRQLKNIFGEDVELAMLACNNSKTEIPKSYEVTALDSDDNITAINVNFEAVDLSDAENFFEANTPYLIKTSKSISEFMVTAQIDPNDPVIRDTNGQTSLSRLKVFGQFQGTYVANTIVPENCLFISNNEFWYSTGNTKMKAFRAYLSLYDNLASLDGNAKISFVVDGDPTTIDGIGYQRISEGVYDLSGRKIQLQDGNLNKLQKGVYIIDGKKVTIK